MLGLPIFTLFTCTASRWPYWAQLLKNGRHPADHTTPLAYHHTMRKRSVALLLLLLTLTAVSLLSWRLLKPDSSRPVSAGASAKGPKKADSKANVSSDDLKRTPLSGTEDHKRHAIAIVRDAAQKANQPIEFYGKVVDQDDNPIPGVIVKLSVRWTHELLPGTAKDEFNRFELTTDARGRFALTDTKGSLLSVSGLEKEGYDPASSATRQSYWYWASGLPEKYSPDSGNPEVFHMWKKRGAAHLLEKGINAKITANGAPVIFDLRTGERVGSGGDLRVTMIRTPLQIEHGQRNFDWTVTAAVVGGGLIETNSEQPYYAPESGYQPSFEFHMPATSPQWAANMTRVFFLKLKDGRYGRVTVEFYPGFYEPGISFHALINPDFSRNLEYNPLQDVALPYQANKP